MGGGDGAAMVLGWASAGKSERGVQRGYHQDVTNSCGPGKIVSRASISFLAPFSMRIPVAAAAGSGLTGRTRKVLRTLSQLRRLSSGYRLRGCSLLRVAAAAGCARSRSGRRFRVGRSAAEGPADLVAASRAQQRLQVRGCSLLRVAAAAGCARSRSGRRFRVGRSAAEGPADLVAASQAQQRLQVLCGQKRWETPVLTG